MADYSSNLKTWGATGTEYPDGYSYLEGEQPVDDWDNFIRHNAIEDVGHLIDLTNDRIESDSGTSHPASPEASHLSHLTDEERLYFYDSTASSWHGLFKIDGDTLQGTLDAGGQTIKNVGKLELSGNVDLLGNDLADEGATIYDSANDHVPIGILEQSEVTVNAGSHLSGTETVSLGGSVTLDVDDDFVLNTGDTMSGELSVDRAEGSRHVTAENTTSGDRLAVQSETDGDFSIVGYDASAGTWETDSALEYSPGSGVWTFKSLPTVNGNTLATRTWTDENVTSAISDHKADASNPHSVSLEQARSVSGVLDGSIQINASGSAATGAEVSGESMSAPAYATMADAENANLSVGEMVFIEEEDDYYYMNAE